MKHLTPVALAAALACASFSVQAQTAPAPAASAPDATLTAVKVTASADASAEGLSPAYAGGQVARGGRAGILGTKDNMATPFSITAYTNELIQDQQAKSVGEVLQNDPSVRIARGFGNYQESYFIRGFILGSDDVAFNGLYSLLPRQYIATELFERVEVLRGASAFLIGANPGGGGIGGAVNLLPKRAGNEPLTRVTVGVGNGEQVSVAADVSRRFGPDNATGIRVNLAGRTGDTAVDNESSKLGLAAVGLDWHNRNVRLSADLGWQDNRIRGGRPSVFIGAAGTVPSAPDAKKNFGQTWTHSDERDVFATLRGEVDLTDDFTAWGAYGLRRSKEDNSLASMTVNDATTGASESYRNDNARRDEVDTGEIGIRGKLRTGPVGHDWVASAGYFRSDSKNAYHWGNTAALTFASNLYTPVHVAVPDISGVAAVGNMASPTLTSRTELTSFAVGDTLGLLDDTLLVTLGARFQKLETGSYDYNTTAQYDSYEKSRTSPMVGAVYRLTPQLSLYGNYIEGLSKGDTVGGTTAQPDLVQLSPYVSKQGEIGAKFDGGKIGGGVALFQTKKPRSLADSGFAGVAGENEHRGVELTAFGMATREVKVLGGLTWLDTKQKGTGNAATDGKRVIGVPEFQANLGAEWNVPMLPGFAVDGRVVYTGSSYADAANTLEVPDWTRLDLGARYAFDVQGKAVTVRLRVDNVTDKSYWASVGGYPGSGYLTVGAPRTFNLSASVDF